MTRDSTRYSEHYLCSEIHFVVLFHRPTVPALFSISRVYVICLVPQKSAFIRDRISKAIIWKLFKNVFKIIWNKLFSLVYWGLTPRQQPWSYRGGDYDDDDEMSVSLVEETGAPGWNNWPTASNSVVWNKLQFPSYTGQSHTSLKFLIVKIVRGPVQIHIIRSPPSTPHPVWKDTFKSRLWIW